MSGTIVSVKVVRVVDGDTLRVAVDEREESLRILALDTEESRAGSGKPVTPWGLAAKKEAQRLFSPDDTVMLEFPGSEPADVCWQRYRGNYGRPLVYVRLADGTDFQEHMIREGYSPYFVKYGYSVYAENHKRYIAAERDAQSGHKGIWNQAEVNGSEFRNYAALGVWWDLRARLIDEYRFFKKAHPDAALFNTRLDYAHLMKLAEQGKKATVFTSLHEISRIASEHAIINIGSMKQRFKLFIPKIDDSPGNEILNLLVNRYVSTDADHPRRNYAYVTGPLTMYRNEPQIIVTDINQVSDMPDGVPCNQS